MSHHLRGAVDAEDAEDADGAERGGAPGAASELLSKTAWSLLTLVGARRVMSTLFPAPTRCFFDVAQHPGVRGLVALTIDDAFLRSPRASDSMVGEVRRLLREHDAAATFFVTSSFLNAAIDDDVAALLRDGSELGNHLPKDRPYHRDSREEFAAALEETARTLRRHQPDARWFRAPHGRLSKTMGAVLAERGLTHVMTDAYANDPLVPDAEYVARTVLGAARDGSIVLIHMPERRFRRWNFRALQLTLEGLSRRGLRAVTVSALSDASTGA